jgi:CRISPR/Cas system Type II protein with McrA/HNH and RuvC-like nuclease domain
MILQTSGKTDPRHSSVTCQNNSILSDTAVKTAITLSLIFVPPESQCKHAAGSSRFVWLTQQQITVSTTVNKVIEMVLLTQ